MNEMITYPDVHELNVEDKEFFKIMNPQLMMSALDEPSLLSPVPSVFIC